MQKECVFCFRRLFHLFTFFFLFYYALIGLFKAVRRVIVSAALNMFYLSRLDTPLTIKGWEFLDKGNYMQSVYTLFILMVAYF